MKRLVALLVVVGLLVSVGVAAAAYKKEYKMSLVVGPKGPWGESATMFAKLVKEKTNGRVNIKIFFGGQLFAGKQTNEFLLLRQGVADFALGSTINWSTTIKPLNLFSLPFFFNFQGYNQVDAVEKGNAGKYIFNYIAKRGVVGLGWGENGFRELTNWKKAIKTPDDIKGMKIRVVGSPIFIEIFRALGANPVNMNWGSAVTAFQQHTVDGEENPINAVIIPYKIYDIHKYITVWDYLIDPLILGVNARDWKQFSKEDQKAIVESAAKALAWEKKQARKGLIGENPPAYKFLESKGMKVTVLTPAQRALFKAKTKPVFDKWIKIVGVELVQSAMEDMKK
ncbi:MAG: DctP family TRAP transporter solute-binding subunit [Synergistetes bacterium]|nr:DctP family TRAP transporter solute-binding subunit [Synergistota bacterium]